MQHAVIFASICIAASFAGPDEARLLSDLFLTGKYNSMERPAEDDSSPLLVYYMIDLQQIIDVDELEQLVHINLMVRMKWSDYKLAWNHEKYGNITDIRYPIGKIWKPDILMYNSADEKFDGSYPVNAVLYSSGTVEWIPPGMYKSSCSIDTRWFPFDRQRCEMKFGSWTYDLSKIDLQIEGDATEAITSSYSRNGEWDLIKFSAKRNVKKYDCCINEYVDLTFTLVIQRRKLFYVVNIVAPCVMMAALTLVTFLIPTDAGSKISFCVTILLSLTVFLLMVAQALPATSDAVPLIAIYFGVVMLMNAISVACTVYVLRCHFSNVQVRPMPRWVRKYVNGWLAVLLFVKSREEMKLAAAEESAANRLQPPAVQSRSLLANVRDDVDYSPELHFHSVSSPLIARRERGGYELARGGSSGGKEQRAAAAPPSPSVKYMISPIMRAIFKEMHFITERMTEKSKADAMVSEWRLAAKVIDRFLVLFFLLMSAVAAFATLLAAPDFGDD